MWTETEGRMIDRDTRKEDEQRQKEEGYTETG